MTIPSLGSRPTAWAASSIRSGSGLPMVIGATDDATSMAATIAPAPGRSPTSTG